MGEKLKGPGRFVPSHNSGRFAHLGDREDTEPIKPPSLTDKLARIYAPKENRFSASRPNTPSREELERILHPRKQ